MKMSEHAPLDSTFRGHSHRMTEPLATTRVAAGDSDLFQAPPGRPSTSGLPSPTAALRAPHLMSVDADGPNAQTTAPDIPICRDGSDVSDGRRLIRRHHSQNADHFSRSNRTAWPAVTSFQLSRLERQPRRQNKLWSEK